MKMMETFESDGYQLRFKKISTPKLLSLATVIDLDDINKTEELYNFILENTEIFLVDQWMPLKDGDTYWPNGIDENYTFLTSIIKTFNEEILKKVFTK